ncbi:uncharacterized protein LOC111712214 [Eurytemora carolleeae]|uniref:uncharacterized protein LOC111712214 n=1 Tax=Eurytemora carolleeae TaxID=1294199 RepID=UPI000C77A867|nr:uncharacterized protein LOC111712214 [Eurytemora carolleeae]|eukprot:XP_023342539.1 uncharacterized protein LOC111712214 [Eurytemora affinis]
MVGITHILLLAFFCSLAGKVTAQCNAGIYVQKTHIWSKGYVGKLYLDQAWLENPTEDWKLSITFKSEVLEFKVWDADIVNPATANNYVNNVTSVDIVNKCWNPILYSCQYLELPFLVRYPDWVNDIASSNYDIASLSESVTYALSATGSETYCLPISGQPTSAATVVSTTAPASTIA